MKEADGEDTFGCPKCHALYRGTYKIFTTVHQGKFDCAECQTEVHAWSGVRDYFKWERVA